NNALYRFRVAAVNAVGQGPFSVPSSAVIPTAPVPDETGELPSLNPGETIAIVEGQEVPVTLQVIEEKQLRLSGETFAMDLTSIGINNQIIPITHIDAIIRIIKGEGASVRVTGYGFEPGSVVTLYIFSQPVMLGHIPVLEDGTFDGTLPIPKDLEVGTH